MYSLPSASHIREPSPRTIMGGIPPTALNARAGEFTPPGMTACARWLSLRDCSCLRTMLTFVQGGDYTCKPAPHPYLRNFLICCHRTFGGNHFLGNLHAFPERDVAFDFCGRGFGIAVIPGSSGISFPVYLQVVITGGAFPHTLGVMAAWSEVFLLDRFRREILIAFNLYGFL